MKKKFKDSASNEINEETLETVSGGGHLYKNYTTGEYGYASDRKFHGGFQTEGDAIAHALAVEGYNSPWIKDTTKGKQLGYTEIGTFRQE